MTEVPFLGVRIDGGSGVEVEVDEVGMYGLEENGYAEDATSRINIWTQWARGGDEHSHWAVDSVDVEFARTIVAGPDASREGPARGSAARSELIERVEVDLLMLRTC